MSVRSIRVGGVIAAAAVLWGVACGEGKTGDGTQPACLESPGPLECAPLYGLSGGEIAPTFQQVFDNTLVKSCGIVGCHAGARPEGGLNLDTVDAAYDGLVTAGRVVPGDITCGELVVRLEMGGKSWSMPPASHLSDAELCSVRHWIQRGAAR